jgi:hypothetical protein
MRGHLEIAYRARMPRWQMKRRQIEARHLHARGFHQVVRNTSRTKWDLRHGVDDVLIEPWKEPKAMFPREPGLDGSAATRRIGSTLMGARFVYRQAARFTTCNGALLVDFDRKPATHQFVRCGHARYTPP